MPTLTDFHNDPFDFFLAYGLEVKIRFRTSVIRMREGHEERIAEWQDPLREFNLAPALRHQADLELVRSHFRARRGQKYAFPFTDPLDNAVTAMPFGVGDGVTTQFQLSKTYNSGLTGDDDYYIRPIMLPIASPSIYKDGVLQTSGVSVSGTTGVVTFTSAPANGVILTWTGTFRVPVRFLNAEMYPSVETYQNYDVSLPLLEQRSLVSATMLTEIALEDFVEVVFPAYYSAGATMGPFDGVIVIPTDSGQESRITQYIGPQMHFEVSRRSQPIDHLSTIIHFFLCRKGRAVGHRIRDITDYQLVNELIGVGDDDTTEFQLTKTYTSGGVTQVRKITKPRAGMLIYLDGVAADPQPDIDLTTGLLNFDTAPADAVEITATGEFDVPVRCDSDELTLSITGFEDFNMSNLPFVEIQIDLPDIVVDAPNTQPRAIVTGCGVIPIPDRVAVSKYIEFFGSGGAGKLDLGTLVPGKKVLLDLLRGAASCTVAFLVSHVGVTAGQTLFYHEAPTQVAGFQVTVDTWGRSAMAYASVGGVRLEPEFSGGSLSWECGTAPITPFQTRLRPRTILGGDDALRAYVVTMDWGSKRMYGSGTCFGAQNLFGQIADFNFVTHVCVQGHVSEFADVIIGVTNTSKYIGEEGDYGASYIQNSGCLGAVGIYPESALTSNVFEGRMYEAFLLINRLPVADIRDTSALANTQLQSHILRTQHRPILRYWRSKYGDGPLVKSPNISAEVGAWWRADENVEVDDDNETVVNWGPVYHAGMGTDEATWTQSLIETVAGGKPKQLDVPLLGLPEFTGDLYYADGKKVT